MLFRKKLFNAPKKLFAKNIEPTFGENKSKTKQSGNTVQVLTSSNNEAKSKGSVSGKQYFGDLHIAQQDAKSVVRNDTSSKPSALIAAKMQCSEWLSPNSSFQSVTSSPRPTLKHTSTSHNTTKSTRPFSMMSPHVMVHPAFRSNLYLAPNNLKSLNLNKVGKPRRYGPPNGRNLRVVDRILYSIQEIDENLA